MAKRIRRAPKCAGNVLRALPATVLLLVFAQTGVLAPVTAQTNGHREPNQVRAAASSVCPLEVAVRYGIVAKMRHLGEQLSPTLTAHSVAAVSATNVWVAGEAVPTKSTSGITNT
jgi:hypothetical protein